MYGVTPAAADDDAGPAAAGFGAALGVGGGGGIGVAAASGATPAAEGWEGALAHRVGAGDLRGVAADREVIAGVVSLKDSVQH
jgi:hypothetical protein